ncbi:prepilin-type N-terminal cleavage/methylation domain protein, partial [Vibrio parahaemolyticus EKP-028]
ESTHQHSQLLRRKDVCSNGCG